MPKNQNMSGEDADMINEFLDAMEANKIKNEGSAMSLKQYIDSLMKKDVPSKKHGGSIKIKQEIRHARKVKTNP